MGFTPPYAPNVHVAQAPPMQQAGGFSYGYAPPLTQVNEVGQNSGKNAESYRMDDLPLTLESPRRVGYNFAGWSADNYFEKKVIDLLEENLKISKDNNLYIISKELPRSIE